MNQYKVAIYGICKNEETQVDGWINSMLEADFICVLDTGSTDKTYQKLKAYQQLYPEKIILAQEEIRPWRFDVARNESMKLIPKEADFCLCTDLDERLQKGWGKVFKAAWELSENKTRLFYKYAWSHNSDGSPARVFWYDKCHDNSGNWVWRFPVHETLTYIGPDPEKAGKGKAVDDNIWLHHYPLIKEDRSSYLPLLEQRAKEDPKDYYGLVYLAHEYYYQHQLEKCINFIDTVVLPNVSEQDLYMCKTDLYMFKGKCYFDLKQYDKAITSFKQGIDESPIFRDNYLCLAQVYLGLQRYQDAIDIVHKGLLESRRLYSWLE